MSDDMDKLKKIINEPNPYFGGLEGRHEPDPELRRLRSEYNAACANGLVMKATRILRVINALEKKQKSPDG